MRAVSLRGAGCLGIFVSVMWAVGLTACGGGSGGSSGSAPAAASPGTSVTGSGGQGASPAGVVLTVSVSGNGTISANPAGMACISGSCTSTFDSGTTVTLTAQPVSGYQFAGWGGACAGTASSCTLTMSQARSAMATFTALGAGAVTCSIPRGTASSPSYAASHPRIFVNNAPTLSCLQSLLATGQPSALRFKAMVDDEVSSAGNASYSWSNPKNYGFQNWFAALMFRVTGSTAYADFAIQRVDAMVSSEEALIASGKAASVSGDSYLDVGIMVGDVALVYDWCYDRLSASQRTRWVNYMNQAVYNVWNPSAASWGGKPFPWSGWAIDDPSDNYYYSFLRATMLAGLATLGDSASASQWLNQFRTAKIGNELLPTFNRDLAGGGSREGTGYGVAMKSLFLLYDWWERSTGERIATLTPHTLSSMAWMLHMIVPTLDHLAAVGDESRDSSVALFDYHREYLLSLISLFPQERLSSVAKTLLDNSSVPRMANGFEYFADYVFQPPALPAASLTDLSTTYWGSGTGQLLMRSAWGDKTAAFAEFACGPYTQSHAHHDQGAFQIYRGEWLAPTGNIYTNSGIQQGEDFNNLVRVTDASGNIISQVYGSSCRLAALTDNSVYTYAVAQVTPVYAGKTSIQKVEREFLFIKPGTFVVFDRVASSSGTHRVWTLNLPDVPTLNGDQLTYVGPHSDRMDVFRVAPSGLGYTVNLPSLGPYDTSLNARARRIDVTDTAGAQSNFLHVIATNSVNVQTVSNVTRSDASGQTGVSFKLSDGRTVTVRFNNDSTGGSLSIVDGGGATIVSGALPTTVTAPALFVN